MLREIAVFFRSARPALLVAASLAVTVAIAGCGIRGPLKPPPKAAADVPAVPATPAAPAAVVPDKKP